ncbi:MAG: MoaD/ThiS family protein [Planctomycetota bacterium]
MSVRVRLHAGVRERAGTAELEVEGGTVAAVREAIAAACPAIADRLEFCRFAAGDEFVGEETALSDGATVDLIPPVSGG